MGPHARAVLYIGLTLPLILDPRGKDAWQRRELLTQGLPVDARHEARPDGLLASLDGHHRREHRQALPGGQGAIASVPVPGLALDALPLGVVLPVVAGPNAPARA